MRRVRARWERLPAWWVDGGIAALVIAVDLTLLAHLVPVVSQIPDWGSRGSSAAAVPVALAARLPLVLRRRYPRAVLVVVTAMIVLERVMELPTSDLAMYVALFTVAIGCPRRHALVALGLVVVVRGSSRSRSTPRSCCSTCSLSWCPGYWVTANRPIARCSVSCSADRAVGAGT